MRPVGEVRTRVTVPASPCWACQPGGTASVARPEGSATCDQPDGAAVGRSPTGWVDAAWPQPPAKRATAARAAALTPRYSDIAVTVARSAAVVGVGVAAAVLRDGVMVLLVVLVLGCRCRRGQCHGHRAAGERDERHGQQGLSLCEHRDSFGWEGPSLRRTHSGAAPFLPGYVTLVTHRRYLETSVRQH